MGTLGMVVSRDGRRIVNGAENGKITTWDVERKIIGVLSHHARWANRLCTVLP
jgi:hypothetical protein